MTTCSEKYCENPSRQRGLCPKHDARKRNGSHESKYDPTPNPKCSVSHCDLEATSRASGALCTPHYQKKYRGRDPETYEISPNHPARSRPACSVQGCQKTSVSQKAAVCDYHRRQARKGKIEAPGVKMTGPCTFEGCGILQSQAGYCHGHYEQLRTMGALKPLRDYGKYVTGRLRCPIPGCKRPQEVKGLCVKHSKMTNRYGVTVNDLMEIWKDPKCSNPRCLNTTRLHMDHDHTSGKFRALLCSGCNSALGLLREDAERISGLREYLERF